jgi:hypothetical protein
VKVRLFQLNEIIAENKLSVILFSILQSSQTNKTELIGQIKTTEDHSLGYDHGKIRNKFSSTRTWYTAHIQIALEVLKVRLTV